MLGRTFIFIFFFNHTTRTCDLNWENIIDKIVVQKTLKQFEEIFFNSQKHSGIPCCFCKKKKKKEVSKHVNLSHSEPIKVHV